MVLQPESVRRMAMELLQVAAELDKYRTVTVDRLQSDLSLRWTVERGLLAGLTLLFNIGDHILAAMDRYPESYEETLQSLAEAGVISRELRAGFQGAGGFRNVLVHEYVEIDLSEVAEAAHDSPDHFRRYAGEILKWLDANPPPPPSRPPARP